MSTDVIQTGVPGQSFFHAGGKGVELQETEANHRERARDHADQLALVYEARLDVAREAGLVRERTAEGFGILAALVKDSERRTTEAVRAEGERSRELVNAIERDRLRDLARPRYFAAPGGTTVVSQG